ncbi:hypothetical protein AVEN_197524-1 [Araneus ventricosus]|uniref:Uncharacterized protein n=1 Tax=Araneus ventricosus TaxID=182803 RepID=A0A4Y2BRL5_ARAVE|nr:hypothetical protein AVEN_197524-1 [Araneus ventricosus]
MRVTVNFFIAAVLMIAITIATSTAVNMPPDRPVTLSCTFNEHLEENDWTILLHLFILQMMFTHKYVFPCLVAVIFPVFYYECIELLFSFQVSLMSKHSTLNRSKILYHSNVRSSLFKLMHKLQDAVSSPCFFLLCSQKLVMFCIIAICMLKSTPNYVSPFSGGLV